MHVLFLMIIYIIFFVACLMMINVESSEEASYY